MRGNKTEEPLMPKYHFDSGERVCVIPGEVPLPWIDGFVTHLRRYSRLRGRQVEFLEYLRDRKSGAIKGSSAARKFGICSEAISSLRSMMRAAGFPLTITGPSRNDEFPNGKISFALISPPKGFNP